MVWFERVKATCISIRRPRIADDVVSYEIYEYMTRILGRAYGNDVGKTWGGGVGVMLIDCKLSGLFRVN